MGLTQVVVGFCRRPGWEGRCGGDSGPTMAVPTTRKRIQVTGRVGVSPSLFGSEVASGGGVTCLQGIGGCFVKHPQNPRNDVRNGASEGLFGVVRPSGCGWEKLLRRMTRRDVGTADTEC